MKYSITLHHSAVAGNAPQFDAILSYHLAKFGEIAYAFVIEKTGTVIRGGEESKTFPHSGNAYYNMTSIPICLAGDFTKEQPTEQQIRSLFLLVLDLQRRYGISNEGILLHKEVRQTACPGMADLRFLLKEEERKHLAILRKRIENRIERATPTRKERLKRALNRLLTSPHV